MTDEKVKEEFEKFEDNPIPKEAVAFSNDIGGSSIATSDAPAFYAGFRTAERLAKIEVLEEVLSLVRCEYPFMEVQSMIDHLKADTL